MNTKVLDLKKSINEWELGIPIGDGKLGSLIYGSGPLRVSVDRIDLWDNRPNEQTFEKGFNYKNLIKLARSGVSGNEEDWAEHHRLFDRLSHITPYPSKITAGRFELDFGEESESIHSYLDMNRAVADITFPSGKSVRAFNSAIRHIGVMKIKGDFELDIHIPDYISGDENGKCSINTGLDEDAENWCMQYPRAEVVKDGEFIYYHQKTHTDYNYTLMAMKKNRGDYVEVYYTVATADDGDNVVDIAKSDLTAAFELGYENLLSEHIEWWKEYNSKSSVVIPDKSIEFIYNVSNYYFASTSRKGFFPMALQGVWTADNDSLPPWKGDYHFDTNVQVSYQHYLKANRLSEGEVIVDYLWNMRDAYKRYAKEFFGVDGYLLPSCSTIKGQPIGGWAMYSYAPIMTVWMIQSFDEYYLYTGDEKFLRTRAYPIFKETGKAILALMEEKNGKLYLPLSSSPEIYDNTKKAYLEPNSNFDLSLLIYLYTKLRDYSVKLGKDSKKYEEILSKLDPLALTPEGILMLDKKQKLPESHRHFSNTMCIYPLHLINYDTEENKRIINRTITDVEEMGRGWWVGFSYAMMAQVYAMAGRGNAAYMRIWEFCKFFCDKNGFHFNGDFNRYGISRFVYKPFTLEANYCCCDALQEMLLQEHEGYINLLPAIPDEWKESAIEFKKLRSYGGLLISVKFKDGKIIRLEFNTKKARQIKIKDAYGIAGLIGIKSVDGFITLDLKRGKAIFK